MRQRKSQFEIFSSTLGRLYFRVIAPKSTSIHELNCAKLIKPYAILQTIIRPQVKWTLTKFPLCQVKTSNGFADIGSGTGTPKD